MSNAENRNDVAPTEATEDGWVKEVQSNPVGGIAGAAVGVAVGVVSGIAAGPVGSLAGAVVGAVVGGLAGSHALAGGGAPAGAASAEPATASTEPEARADGTAAAAEPQRLDMPDKGTTVLIRDEAGRDKAAAESDPTRQGS